MMIILARWKQADRWAPLRTLDSFRVGERALCRAETGSFISEPFLRAIFDARAPALCVTIGQVRVAQADD